jgi:hypothetical protein
MFCVQAYKKYAMQVGRVASDLEAKKQQLAAKTMQKVKDADNKVKDTHRHKHTERLPSDKDRGMLQKY